MLTTALPSSVRTAPPPRVPPPAVSTTAAPNPLLSSSTRTQVRRYDIFNVRPAAEIEPARAICSSTAILPGPILPPDVRSILMLSWSLALGGLENLRGGFRMTASKPRRKSIDQSPREIAVAGRRHRAGASKRRHPPT